MAILGQLGVPSFYPVGLQDQTQGFPFGGQYLYPLRYPDGSIATLYAANNNNNSKKKKTHRNALEIKTILKTLD